MMCCSAPVSQLSNAKQRRKNSARTAKHHRRRRRRSLIYFIFLQYKPKLSSAQSEILVCLIIYQRAQGVSSLASFFLYCCLMGSVLLVWEDPPQRQMDLNETGAFLSG
jgi:hypothetical protein